MWSRGTSVETSTGVGQVSTEIPYNSVLGSALSLEPSPPDYVVLKFEGNYVPGEGPEPCDLLFVGEAPGRDEDDAGRPFVGLAGAVLDTHLQRFGRPRHTVRVTNLYKRRPSENNDDPTPEQISEGMKELIPEIQRCNPRIIVTVGRLSTKALLPSFTTMEEMHGIPQPFPMNSGITILPMIHPAAGMHEPRLMEKSIQDLETAVKMSQTGECPWEVDSGKPGYYGVGGGYGLGPPKDVEGQPPKQFLIRGGAIDTEGLPNAPTHLSYSVTANTGRVLLAEDVRAGRFKVEPGSVISLQHALWDLPVLEAMDIDLLALGCTIKDPMIMAFVLQDEEQGLKYQSFKYRGRYRKDFNEVAGPHFARALADWYAQQAEEKQKEYDKIVEQVCEQWKLQYPDKKFTKKVQVEIHKFVQANWVATDAWYMVTRAISDGIRGKSVDLQARLKGLPPEQLMHFTSKPPKYDLTHTPVKEMVDYTCADSDDTVYITHRLETRIQEQSLGVVCQIDHDVLPMLHRFQKTGLPIDVEAARDLSQQLGMSAGIHEMVMRDLSGAPELNADSGDQIASALEGLLVRSGVELWKFKSTKSGKRMSTDDESIETMFRKTREVRGAGADRLKAFLTALRGHRSDSKLKSTFVDTFTEKALSNSEQRCHFRVKYTRQYTGRISYEDPNVGAVPRDKRVRRLIKAKPGRLIVAGDLSQIEPRTMAHVSGDRFLTDIYLNKKDLYRQSAAEILHSTPEAISTEVRYAFKQIDLSLIFLISTQGLYDKLLWEGVEGYSLEQVSQIREKWFQVMAGVMPYYQWVWGEARKRGFVVDIWGRRRYLPNIYLMPDGSRSGWVNRKLEAMRAEAERQAGNHTIQGSAQGLMKRAMKRIWDEIILPLKAKGVWIEAILQVHDELLIEVEEGWAEVVRMMMKDCLERDTPWFRVPIVAEVGVGPTWADAK